MAERLIAHVDMDAFFAAVEVRDHPGYRGRPVVVGAGPHARGVIAAASYEARRYGIHSAMPSRRAFELCPHAVFLPPDMERYRAESARVFDVLETFTPQIEPVSVDEAFLDLTGCPGPAHTAEEEGTEAGLLFGQAIRRRIRERLDLPASVGVAPNKFLAKVASELAKPDGVRRITPDAVRATLDPLPVEALWGVGPETRARLRDRGLTTIGALRRASVSALRAMLGFSAERLAALSRGEDDRPVEPGGDAKSIGRETTFAQDTRDLEFLVRTLRELCEDVAHRLRADGLAGRIVTLKVRFEPFETRTRRLTLPEPTDQGRRLARAAGDLWRRFEPLQRRVRLVGVTVSGLERPTGSQVGLFEAAGRGRAAEPARPGEEAVHSPVDRVMDAVNERFGVGTLAPAGTVEPRTAARRRRRTAPSRSRPRPRPDRDEAPASRRTQDR
jgi:DNA polymerase-4